MSELGIKPKIVRDPDGGVFIEFKSADQKTISPIEIHLGRDAITTTSTASWTGSKMYATFWEDIELGDNGWTFQEFARSSHSYDIGENEDEFFGVLAEWFRGHGVIHLDRSKGGFTTDEDFARAFEIIKAALPDDEKIEVACERGPASDAYVFTYPAGCDWRVDFVSRSAVVTANGKEVASVYTEELKKLIPVIRSRVKELSVRRDLGT